MNQANDFEKTLEELEAIVSQLDSEIKLEKALELFEKGVLLSKRCEEFLKGAEQKVEILKRLADGLIISQNFEDGRTPTSSFDNEDDDDDDDDDDDEDDDEDEDDDDEDEDDEDEDEDDDEQAMAVNSKPEPVRKTAARAKKSNKESLEIGMLTQTSDSASQLRIKIEES